jgi:signal transduction histidine kinase
MWIGDRLILARRVDGNGAAAMQGCWLNWPALKKRLLNEADGLLPGADLVRADGAAADDPSRMLAGLPVRLVVNETPAPGGVNPTLGWALWMGWGAVGIAVIAAAALLHGVMTLSERRAAFVSSVTHELRTPLTTFRMYAEMLARGMVPDASRRQEYFHTLQREAERLTLLVENVLAYARLERGRRPQCQDRITLKSLFERIGPRLTHRAAQADMKCDLRLGVHAAEQEFVTDQSVVEQILFNLVDNASKYAREATDRQIHVEGSRDGEWMKLVVRDHGPGIEQRKWGRAPQAFGKSAQQSAETAPGVGLGLALCRRLARQLGGRLEVGGANGGGAEVTLLLPIACGASLFVKGSSFLVFRVSERLGYSLAALPCL